MKRKLLFLERIMYGDGYTPFNGVFAVKIRGSFTERVLHYALKKIQAKHPLLNACVVKDKKGIPYFLSGEMTPAIPVRIVERNTDDDWMRESKTEWATPFNTDTGPLLRLVWLKSDDAADLIFAFHHCMCDGGSALALMQELLMLLDDPGKDIGTYTAFTTIDEVIPGVNTVRNRLIATLRATFIRLVVTVASAFISARKRQAIPREKDYLIHWKLDKEIAAALFDGCRKEQVTVNTALCAAFLSAFQYVKGSRSYNVTCPVDIRKYAPGIKNDTIFAFGLAIKLSINNDPASGFWAKARKLQQDASRKMAKLKAGEFLLTFEYAQGAVNTIKKLLTFGKAGNDLMFSNMGRLNIQRKYGAFEVETVYSPTIIGPFNNPTTIITTTFGDEMDFCFVSNDSFLAYSDARVIKEKAMELLSGEVPAWQVEFIVT